jgi:hypothetical protein
MIIKITLIMLSKDLNQEIPVPKEQKNITLDNANNISMDFCEEVQ